MKRVLVLTVIVSIFAGLLVFNFGCDKKQNDLIKIGAILPLTGDDVV